MPQIIIVLPVGPHINLLYEFFLPHILYDKRREGGYYTG